MSVTKWDVTITVEAALSAATGTYGAWNAGLWDTATWGPDETYVDISEYVRSFQTTRKFGREVQSWDSGSSTVVLNNRDGRFCYDNLSGPYVVAGVTGIRPWRPLRIRAAYNGVTYPVAKAYALDWQEGFVPAGPGAGDAIVTAPCTDEWGTLGTKGAAVATVGAGDDFGARLHRILDAAGHTGGRDIDSGTNTMRATDLEGTWTDQMSLTADSEGGAAYVEADGSVVGRRQYALVEDTRSIVVQATFGDGGGDEIPYSGGKIGSPGNLIKNVVSYQREGGTTQTVSDETSRALYKTRLDSRTDLACETDDQVLRLAAWKLARFKAPERRLESFKLFPRKDPTRLWPLALGLKVRDLIKVVRRPPGGHTITQYCHVAGIGHQFDADNWTTTFYLWSASPYRAFSTSLWDTGLWGSGPDDPDAALWFY